MGETAAELLKVTGSAVTCLSVLRMPCTRYEAAQTAMCFCTQTFILCQGDEFCLFEAVALVCEIFRYLTLAFDVTCKQSAKTKQEKHTGSISDSFLWIWTKLEVLFETQLFFY